MIRPSSPSQLVALRRRRRACCVTAREVALHLELGRLPHDELSRFESQSIHGPINHVPRRRLITDSSIYIHTPSVDYGCWYLCPKSHGHEIFPWLLGGLSLSIYSERCTRQLSARFKWREAMKNAKSTILLILDSWSSFNSAAMKISTESLLG